MLNAPSWVIIGQSKNPFILIPWLLCYFLYQFLVFFIGTAWLNKHQNWKTNAGGLAVQTQKTTWPINNMEGVLYRLCLSKEKTIDGGWIDSSIKIFYPKCPNELYYGNGRLFFFSFFFKRDMMHTHRNSFNTATLHDHCYIWPVLQLFPTLPHFNMSAQKSCLT